LNPVVYWTDYQVPIVLVAFVVVGTLHYFTQKYMDKRDGHVVQPMEVEKPAEDDPADSAPLWYAVLPVIPLALILSFSPLWITSIKMNIVMAMFIGLFIAPAANTCAGMTAKKFSATSRPSLTV
jgi:DcuC family C4-dicarboxylate transporter